MFMLRFSRHSLTRPNVLATIAAVALFIVVLAAWAWAFHAPAPAMIARPSPVASIDASAGDTLFGAQPDSGHHDAVQLLGILAFDPRHAAAVVSVGDEPAHVVRVNGSIADNTTLSEVRAHSIIVERNGVQREITLPVAQNPSAFVR
jgi:general secretion pathway protein C